MGVGGLVEPLVVVTLLFGGVYVNRNKSYKLSQRRGSRWEEKEYEYRQSFEGAPGTPVSLSSTETLLEAGSPNPQPESKWRTREIGIWGFKTKVTSPNTAVFRDNFLSRLLRKLPFLVECWYWALIYWVYQIGRAISALTLDASTVDVARHHALQVIEWEKRLHIFWELQIQQAFMKHETLMHWINRIYSYIHIPGTIFFLVWLYYYTIVRNRTDDTERQPPMDYTNNQAAESTKAGSLTGALLYQARRRTMAMCNLLAFIVFTAWPCMPPRLLSDLKPAGAEADIGRTYKFVDTVHSAGGESSVWTQNKFCNQYAAMPSLHFGYSLMIGLTVALYPLAPTHRRGWLRIRGLGYMKLPSLGRLLCVLVGFAYPFTIFVAIVSTANHFILDAVAGSCVLGIAWWSNRFLLNMLPVEDYFLWCLRLHKPTGNEI